MAHTRAGLVGEIIKSVETLEPGFKTAFLAAVRDTKSSAQLEVVIAAIKNNRMDEVIKALNLTPEFFAPLDDAVRTAFNKGGRDTMQSTKIPPQPGVGTLAIRFGGTNPRAQLWVQKHSSTLITAIVADQRAAVRTVVEAGIRGGVGPRTTALNIVGRIDRSTGRRVGGILGLTSNQAGFVTNARRELESGNKSLLKNYLTRRQRDRRFDSIVQRSIKTGAPISAKDTTRMADRYSDKLLKLRGDTIARTESLAAFNAGRQEGLNQLVDSGAVKNEQVRRIWRTASDSRVRDTHQALNGEVVGLKQEFSNGLMFPAAPGGAPEETINCRCIVETKIDHLASVAPPKPVPPVTPGKKGPPPKPKPPVVPPKPAPPPPKAAPPKKSAPKPDARSEAVIPSTDVDWTKRHSGEYEARHVAKFAKNAPAPYKRAYKGIAAVQEESAASGGVQTSGGAYYRPGNNKIKIALKYQKERRTRVFAHEYGHAIDHDGGNLGRFGRSGRLRNGMIEDRAAMSKTIVKGIPSSVQKKLDDIIGKMGPEFGSASAWDGPLDDVIASWPSGARKVFVDLPMSAESKVRFVLLMDAGAYETALKSVGSMVSGGKTKINKFGTTANAFKRAELSGKLTMFDGMMDQMSDIIESVSGYTRAGHKAGLSGHGIKYGNARGFLENAAGVRIERSAVSEFFANSYGAHVVKGWEFYSHLISTVAPNTTRAFHTMMEATL